MNNPDYVPSVFVYSNTTSNNDKRSCYERLRKRVNKQQTQAKVTTQKRSEQVDLNDSEMLDSEDLQSDSPMCSNTTNEETSSLVVAEEDVTNGENLTNQETVDNEANETIPRKVDKSLSTTIDSTHWHMNEKRWLNNKT